MSGMNDFDDGNSSMDCAGQGDRWWAYLAIDAVLYTFLLSCSAIIFALHWLLTVKAKSKACFGSRWKVFRDGVRQIVSGDTILGKILVCVTLLCNLIYLGLAIQRSFPPHMLEDCVDISHPEVIVELAITVELLVFALVRLLASSNVVLFWFQPHTIVDVVTLSHVFIAVYFGVDWVGLRSLRFIWLTQVAVVLQFTPLLKSQNAADLFNLFIYFLILWLTSSGILHLIETQGDFWKDVPDAEAHSVLIYVYLTMVTMSTVGYGDFFAVTDLGRGFMILFIIAGLAFFAAILPTLVEVVTDLYAKYQYAKFDTTRVPRHVIVCGHVTDKTAYDFLKDFLHPDRGDTQTHVLFLHPERPDKDLKNVLRSYYTRVQFLLGSVLNGKDLQKALISSSTAIFILANKHTDNPTEEDHANLLRVVSVKNTTDKIPVVIQLLNSFSKVQVANIEGWSSGRDIAVCLNELKLGLLAQSCLCPGFSTLVANLFYNISDLPKSSVTRGTAEKWKEHYFKGASNEVYSSPFSEFFDGMTFHEAAGVCFNKLNLVMLALEQIEEDHHYYFVNPSVKVFPNMRVNSKTMLGYFIAQDKPHVTQVSVYFESQKPVIPKREQLLRSKRLSFMRRSIPLQQLDGTPSNGGIDNLSVETRPDDLVIHFYSHAQDYRKPNLATLKEEESLDVVASTVTGSPVSGLLTPIDAASAEKEVECDDYQKQEFVTCDPIHLESSILNPDVFSRASPDPKADAELKDHIILCLFADKNSPLLGVHNFLKPLRSKHIPPESIKPVVVICEKDFIEKEWPILCDIPKVYLVAGSPLLWSNLIAAKVGRCSVCVILTLLNSTSGHERAIDDKEAVLCSLSIQKKLKQLKKDVLVITDLRQESNVQFLDFGDEDTPDERIYKAQPFACGEAFSVSMFDSVTSSVFHSPGTLYLVENIIHSSGTKAACQVVSKSISETRFAGKTFGEFYNAQLKDYKICVGLSRKLAANSNQSYVITSPDSNLTLERSDVAFVLS